MRKWLPLLFLPACLFLSGCSGIAGPQACTLIGCYSGLEVLVVDTPEPFRIEVEVPGQTGRYVYECADPSLCRGPAFFADFTPDLVRIHVITASGSTTHIAQPKYEVYRPNGPDCPPTCRTARVTIERSVSGTVENRVVTHTA